MRRANALHQHRHLGCASRSQRDVALLLAPLLALAQLQTLAQASRRRRKASVARRLELRRHHAVASTASMLLSASALSCDEAALEETRGRFSRLRVAVCSAAATRGAIEGCDAAGCHRHGGAHRAAPCRAGTQGGAGHRLPPAAGTGPAGSGRWPSATGTALPAVAEPWKRVPARGSAPQIGATMVPAPTHH